MKIHRVVGIGKPCCICTGCTALFAQFPTARRAHAAIPSDERKKIERSLHHRLQFLNLLIAPLPIAVCYVVNKRPQTERSSAALECSHRMGDRRIF
jgi:hypothetical protein